MATGTNDWPGKGGEVGRYPFGVNTFANPIGAVGDYAATLHYAPREVVVARLHGGVVAQFPVDPSAQNATLTVIGGRLVAVVVTLDASQNRTGIAYDTGIALAGDTTAPPPPGGTVSAPVDLGPILAAIAALKAQVDALQTDMVGRTKAHDERMSAMLNAVQHGVDGLPDAIVGEVPAGDHFGLDARAQFGNRWQELFAYVLTARQDFWQVAIERFFEGAHNMEAEGFDPTTGQYTKK